MLIDVRSRDEYERAHIVGTLNVPLDQLDQVRTLVPDTNTPIYVFCLSGGRSGHALKELERMGYVDVVNAGGMNRWTGPVAKGAE